MLSFQKYFARNAKGKKKKSTSQATKQAGELDLQILELAD